MNEVRNYPYISCISDVTSAQIGLTSSWHTVMYMPHMHDDGYGIQCCFPYTVDSSPVWRCARHAQWQNWREYYDDNVAHKQTTPKWVSSAEITCVGTGSGGLALLCTNIGLYILATSGNKIAYRLIYEMAGHSANIAITGLQMTISYGEGNFTAGLISFIEKWYINIPVM